MTNKKKLHLKPYSFMQDRKIRIVRPAHAVFQSIRQLPMFLITVLRQKVDLI